MWSRDLVRSEVSSDIFGPESHYQEDKWTSIIVGWKNNPRRISHFIANKDSCVLLNKTHHGVIILLKYCKRLIVGFCVVLIKRLN